MAYAILHHFPGGTKEQYEAAIAAVHPADGSLPEGVAALTQDEDAWQPH